MWLDLYWLQPHGPNIKRHPERLERIDEVSRGYICVDLAAALTEIMAWIRGWSYLRGFLLVGAEIRERQPWGRLLGRVACEDDVYDLMRREVPR